MNWTRSAGRIALGLLLTAAALPAAAAGTPDGPVCLATAAPASETVVRVLTLDDLAPERAARLRARLARLQSGSAVVAVDPKAAPATPGISDRLAAISQEHQEAFARLQKTEPELLSNGMYRLDVGRTFLTPLVAMPAADGTLSIDHAGAPARPEVKP